MPLALQAGNINSCLLKSPGQGDFMMVLDCDMIVHPGGLGGRHALHGMWLALLGSQLRHFPAAAGVLIPQSARSRVAAPPAEQPALPAAADFLLRTLGHFYTEDAGSPGSWRLKDKAAFLQTPQSFRNVEAADPLVHCACFFYGPSKQSAGT